MAQQKRSGQEFLIVERYHDLASEFPPAPERSFGVRRTGEMLLVLLLGPILGCLPWPILGIGLQAISGARLQEQRQERLYEAMKLEFKQAQELDLKRSV